MANEFRVTASVSVAFGRIGNVSAGLIVATPEEARAIAATFPKSVGVKASEISGSDEGTGYVSFSVWLSPDAANKGKNETGLKRLRRFLQIASWRYDAEAFGNSATRDQFDDLVK